ncbi:MAG: hypothetical protein MJ164_02970 [Alphaproteobacteria bacterium]|nr:hypothetical protein [Alphaproteobacteria bacterium]
MHKKHIFLRVFSKINIFACVFCVFSVWAETTTCGVDFTPVTGNSWQNGTPTPTNPVEIKSIGTKVGNKYAVQVAVNYDGGVVDLGSLSWIRNQTTGIWVSSSLQTKHEGSTNLYCSEYTTSSASSASGMNDMEIKGLGGSVNLYIKDITKWNTLDEQQFKQAMSGVMLYYQRATDENWTAPTLRTIYLDEPLRKVGEYADVLDYKNGTITRNVGVKVLDGTEDWSSQTISLEQTFGPYISMSNWGAAQLSNRFPNYLYCSHFKNSASGVAATELNVIAPNSNFSNMLFAVDKRICGNDLTSWKAWLTAQYAAGTPVTVYYPLATPVVEQIENWSCIPPITEIKIATTKMVDDEFAATEAKLAATVQTIESVVSRTIAQTGQIQVLQDTKQTRPDETCPANMKCLLVQDEDGTPHWYPIIEP